MFKTGKVLLIVDSVEKAVKFYTEKLLFSIAGLECDDEGGIHLNRAEVRKGKFCIIFRLPLVEELTEFSMIRRSNGRATMGVAVAKKGIASYLKSCKKKNLEVSDVAQAGDGSVTGFSLKDPFGFKLFFTEEESVGLFDLKNFCGMPTEGEPVVIKKDKDVPAPMVKWLRGFGISRRVAKKYIKVWAKKTAKQ